MAPTNAVFRNLACQPVPLGQVHVITVCPILGGSPHVSQPVSHLRWTKALHAVGARSILSKERCAGHLVSPPVCQTQLALLAGTGQYLLNTRPAAQRTSLRQVEGEGREQRAFLYLAVRGFTCVGEQQGAPAH